jgi:chaperonin cofactor prefoldin
MNEFDEIKRKLEELNKEHHNIGAYAEYGDLMLKMLTLQTQSKSESDLEKRLSELKDTFDSMGFSQKFNSDYFNNYLGNVKKSLDDLNNKVNDLQRQHKDVSGQNSKDHKHHYEDTVNNTKQHKDIYNTLEKLKRSKEISFSNFNEGVLLIHLYDNHEYGHLGLPFNNQEVEISGNQGSIFLRTKSQSFSYDDGSVESKNGICKRLLHGGNYTVIATVDGETQTGRITVDGETYLGLKFTQKG